ncbi:MAG: Crp/Fnr family transcriptional regulator [Herminiimonas sp.]|nr:Crp/Fnr family transcriptional regulator [Herminiimonas sp.]
MAIPHITPHSPKQNHLLAALPDADFRRLLPELEAVQMKIGQPLYETGSQMRHVYFPANSIVSLLYVTRNGAATEIAVIGNEGMVGVALFMGGETTQNPTMVKSSGYAYRLKESVIKEEFKHCESLQYILLRYTHALLAQITQTAACNRHHSIDQQFCRCLLSSLDRLPSNEVSMTQEFIANTLGVRRESVTEAAKKLQSAGLIHYSRGHIIVTDRKGLESEVCECYSVVKKEYDRMRSDRIAA